MTFTTYLTEIEETEALTLADIEAALAGRPTPEGLLVLAALPIRTMPESDAPAREVAFAAVDPADPRRLAVGVASRTGTEILADGIEVGTDIAAEILEAVEEIVLDRSDRADYVDGRMD